MGVEFCNFPSNVQFGNRVVRSSKEVSKELSEKELAEFAFPVDKIPIVLSNLNVEFNHCGEDLTVLENVNVTIKQVTHQV